MSQKPGTSQPALVLGFPDYEPQARRLAEQAGLPYACITLHHFPDGESKLQLPAALPAHVVLCRNLDHPNQKLVELMLTAAGARTLGASTVSLVAPYLCYMRQDMAFHPGEVVSQQIVGQWLASHFDNVLTVDAHLHRVHRLADCIPAKRAINLTATKPMAHFIQQHFEHPYLLGPDSESVQWVEAIATPYRMDYGVARKERHGDRDVTISLPDGDYWNRHIVLVDDVASTGKTLLEAARALEQHHPASISVLVTHALFVDDAVEQLRDAGIRHIWSADSIPHPTNAVELAELMAGHLDFT
jgi:ribose-phosphate pyrophosphokinase